MTVLVTGGSGFVGLNVLEALLTNGETVISCDLGPVPGPALQTFGGLAGTLHEETLDVRDRAAVLALVARFRPSKVVHAAAISPAAGAELEAAGSIVAVNIGGTVNLLDAAHMAGADRIIILSSAAVYGKAGFRFPLLTEETPAEPTSIYGISKFAAEQIALRYRDLGCDLAALRLGSIFGPWEHVTSVRGTISPMWQILELAKQGGPIRLPRPGRRDWIYGRDVGAAVVAALDFPGRVPALVNIGAGSQWTVADFCSQMSEAGVALDWAIDPTEPNVDYHGPRDRAPLSTVVLREFLNFSPRFDIRSAIVDYLAWAEANRRRVPRQDQA
ncbi:MAG: NAD(P)-dependent oxidoreductase [Alphaproteobacteria bacterium]|nr:NAD(P)-dependent oxidoreductase [Alphaproteobacteria bacterium]